MSGLRFQLDEDCQTVALARALRQHGIDVVTTNELGLRGVDDETQLREAAGRGRLIVTNNINDFARLHARWLAKRQPHSGIVLFAQQGWSLGEVVRRLARLSRTVSSDDMKNRLEWLNDWGTR